MIRICLFLTAFLVSKLAATPELRPSEARAAFSLLNEIRMHPAAFADTLSFLKGLPPMPALKWNDTLARVAAQKALDMATRNYFAHTNPDGFGMNYFINQAGYKLQPSWIQDKTANYFESCAAGATTGKEAIAMLLVDDGVPSFGHRTHLLGLNDWSRSLVDIGIGYAWAGGASNYISYTCVLIAKH